LAAHKLVREGILNFCLAIKGNISEEFLTVHLVLEQLLRNIYVSIIKFLSYILQTELVWPVICSRKYRVWWMDIHIYKTSSVSGFFWFAFLLE